MIPFQFQHTMLEITMREYKWLPSILWITLIFLDKLNIINSILIFIMLCYGIWCEVMGEKNSSKPRKKESVGVKKQ